MDHKMLTTKLINGCNKASILHIEFNTNSLNKKTFRELNDVLNFVEQFQATDNSDSINGVIFSSKKKNIFLAGADLFELSTLLDTPKAIEVVIEYGQETFTRISKLTIPTVACIHGACLGGGYELALACDYRIASNEQCTKIGLPEVTLGILPAWGGTTRLPRLIGLTKSLKVILGGAASAAKPALKLGLIDKLQHKELLVGTAVKLIRSNKISAKDPEVTCGLIFGGIILNQAKKMVTKKTKGNYPAPYKIIEVLRQSVKGSIADSLKLEKEAFMDLVETEEMKNLLRIFFLQEKYKKLTVTDCKTPSIDTCAVVGAGTMGAGIAQWLSSKGKKVYIKEVNEELVAKGLKTIGDLYVAGIHRHKFDRPTARASLANIVPVTANDKLHDTGIVIEAIVEKLDVKQNVLAELEEYVTPDCIIATNTSALSIDDIACKLKQPERFIGIHFFNPVHKMQLVEIVRGSKTSDETVQRAVKFVQSIGKLPVVVRDSPGFVVNRILVPYLINACNLYEDGYTIEEIDQTMVGWGMPMGPFRLMDEIGIDICQHVAADLYSRLPGIKDQLPTTLEQLIKKDKLGKKSNAGFYEYKKGKSVKKSTTVALENESIILYTLVNSLVSESRLVLKERVAESAEDIDFAMIMGTGFAPFRGGPLNFKVEAKKLALN